MKNTKNKLTLFVIIFLVSLLKVFYINPSLRALELHRFVELVLTFGINVALVVIIYFIYTRWVSPFLKLPPFEEK